MSPRILAIDDSDQNLALIELYLKHTEFEVQTARSGAEGLARVRQEHFDLILLDVVMPRMDGFEVCERLKSDPRTKEIPVIFLTGQMQAEAKKLQAFEIGAVDYLSKPVHGDELVARIRVMLRLRAASAGLEADNIRLARDLQQANSDLLAARAELQDLRTLADEDTRGPVFCMAIGRDGAVRHRDPAFDSFAREHEVCDGGHDADRPERAAERIVLQELARHDPDHDNCGELRLPLTAGGVRAMAWERFVVPDGRDQVALIRLRDVTRARELQAAVAARGAMVPGGGSNLRTATPIYRMTGMIGNSAELLSLAKIVDRLRNVRSTVLIYGESGTGKELVARALHFDGQFKSQPFIPIHCGAMSPHLIESELFGHEKGAFTGAAAASRGLLTAADGGTVLLDEIAETTPDLQIKLLRVIQLGEVRPVGSTHSQRVDLRFIAATNGDLTERVRAGKFREDLFHRLHVVTLRLPPLRDRIGDVLPLAEHFLNWHAKRQERAVPLRLSRAAAMLLEAYPWPGNVRELENVMIGVLSLGCSAVVQDADLPEHVRECRPPLLGAIPQRRRETKLGPAHLVGDSAGDHGLRARRAEVDRGAIFEALSRAGGDKRRAAADLGMSKSTLYRKLRELTG